MTPPDLLTRARALLANDAAWTTFGREAGHLLSECVAEIERLQSQADYHSDCRENRLRLEAEIERLTQEVARFSTLADERHDALFACHRERDMDRAVMATLTQERDEARGLLAQQNVKLAVDGRVKYSQAQLDAATKPLHVQIEREQAIRQRLREWLEEGRDEPNVHGPGAFRDALEELTRLEQAPAPTPTRREE